jgi:hypothetical protein
MKTAEISNPVRKYLAEIGRRGGRTITPAKSQTARLNGLKGGRPKKQEDREAA